MTIFYKMVSRIGKPFGIPERYIRWMADVLRVTLLWFIGIVCFFAFCMAAIWFSLFLYDLLGGPAAAVVMIMLNSFIIAFFSTLKDHF